MSRNVQNLSDLWYVDYPFETNTTDNLFLSKIKREKEWQNKHWLFYLLYVTNDLIFLNDTYVRHNKVEKP